MPERPLDRDDVGSDLAEGWRNSPLEQLERRATKLEESVAILTELVQGLVRRIELIEDDDDDEPDWDDDDEEDEEDDPGQEGVM